MIQKNRHPHEESHGMAKLTAQQVTEIRRMANEYVPRTKLASLYGVSLTNIVAIIKRQIWKQIP
jgi:hypothetical protein